MAALTSGVWPLNSVVGRHDGVAYALNAMLRSVATVLGMPPHLQETPMFRRMRQSSPDSVFMRLAFGFRCRKNLPGEHVIATGVRPSMGSHS